MAAHAAAALTLSAVALSKFTAESSTADYIAAAEGLLEYSQQIAPIDATEAQLRAATDPRPNISSDVFPKFGVRRVLVRVHVEALRVQRSAAVSFA